MEMFVNGKQIEDAVAKLHQEDLPELFRALSAGEEERQCDPMKGLGFLEMRSVP